MRRAQRATRRTGRMEAYVTQDFSHIPLSQDAALVVTLAGTAMAFSHSAEDQAERWLRALRLHGQVGNALQALGVGEAPLMTGSEPDGPVEEPADPPLGGDAVDEVTRRAQTMAHARSADTVGTADVLFAVLDLYDRLFDRALYLRGTSREELLEKLSAVTEHRS
jgi:hypothetical protein